MIINDSSIPEEERENTRMELKSHNSAAREQRRAVTEFTRKYECPYGIENQIPGNILPEYIDEEVREEVRSTVNVLLVCEDFGQGIALPNYGHVRPSCDYFNSNFMLHLYVISDISRNTNNLILYNERCQEKDKDALFSLRLFFNFRNRNACIERGEILPNYFISIRDNDVSQSESNTLSCSPYYSTNPSYYCFFFLVIAIWQQIELSR